jgi:hypothetical protein
LELRIRLALGAAKGEQAFATTAHPAVDFRRFRAADVGSSWPLRGSQLIRPSRNG